jgi:DNA modification methylase
MRLINPTRDGEMKKAAHQTRKGKYYIGKAETLLDGSLGSTLKGKVQLILTSPPFPLNKKKSYGNLVGREYYKWFVNLASLFSGVLKEDGSIVIELGNAWVSGKPVQSLLPMKCLMGFVKNRNADLRLCQHFVCYNPARLPSPAQWVTVKRIRLTDSFTNVWWMANSDYPKADNKKVLRPYSESMQLLLQKEDYNDGLRPSEHKISEKGFLKRHRGSIQPNLLELEPIDDRFPIRLPNAMRIANTGSNDYFSRACRKENITPHPARMPPELVAFFINFLTEPGDLVLDPFAGSNTTGYVAELLGRRWTSIDVSSEYVEQSRIRFQDPLVKKKRKRKG